MSLDEAVAAATRAWFTPRNGGRGAPFRPDGAEPSSIRFEDVELAGYTVGTGCNTALLVHGWGSSSEQMSPLIDPLLDAGYRVAGFDLPGHGASGGVETDVFQLGRAVVHVAAEISGVSVVVAHSIGAPATVGALDAGLHLEAAVFIAPGTRLKDAFAVFVDRSEMPAGVADGLRAAIEHRFGADIWDEMQMVHSTGALDLPVLLIHDPADRQAPIEPVRTVAARWRGARLIEVEGLGHNRILSAPEVASHLLSFLDQVATSDV